MFDSYEEFIYFIAQMIKDAKELSDKRYNEWKEKCLTMEKETENQKFLKEVLKIIDEYSGHGCQAC